jgi:hypothetical protein
MLKPRGAFLFSTHSQVSGASEGRGEKKARRKRSQEARGRGQGKRGAFSSSSHNTRTLYSFILQEERRLRAEAREAERIKEESERRRMEQERAELRARRLMEREGLLRRFVVHCAISLRGSHLPFHSDRLHVMKSSGSGSGSGACSPALHVETAFGGTDSGNHAECHAVTPDRVTAIQNGDPVVKKAKLSIQDSSSTPGGECAPLSAPADIKKVVPTPGDLLALAIEIKREHPGWGVKRFHLQMLERHPDWAITEHRVNKLLHENGLANVRTPCSAAKTFTDANQPLTEQQEQAGAAVADIHFDILSLPQTHNSSPEILQSASCPSFPNAGPTAQQFADMVDLDKLFKPVTGASACTAAHTSNTHCSDIAAAEDLGNGFAAAAAPANTLHSLSD